MTFQLNVVYRTAARTCWCLDLFRRLSMTCWPTPQLLVSVILVMKKQLPSTWLFATCTSTGGNFCQIALTNGHSGSFVIFFSRRKLSASHQQRHSPLAGKRYCFGASTSADEGSVRTGAVLSATLSARAASGDRARIQQRWMTVLVMATGWGDMSGGVNNLI